MPHIFTNTITTFYFSEKMKVVGRGHPVFPLAKLSNIQLLSNTINIVVPLLQWSSVSDLLSTLSDVVVLLFNH